MSATVKTFLLTLPVVFGLHDSFSYYTDCANSNSGACNYSTTGTGTGTFDQFQNLGAGTKNFGATSPLVHILNVNPSKAGNLRLVKR